MKVLCFVVFLHSINLHFLSNSHVISVRNQTFHVDFPNDLTMKNSLQCFRIKAPTYANHHLAPWPNG